MTSMHLAAMPTDIAASTILSISKFRIMQTTALPFSPTMFAFGTRTLSNTSSAVPEALMPHLLLICCPRLKPGMPFSTMNMDTSLVLSRSPVFAYTKYRSPSSPLTYPFVIHIFEPFSTYSSPSARANVLMAKTSVPEFGSDIHMPPIFAPLQMSGRNLDFCSSDPLKFKLFTSNILWAKYAKQNPGSDFDNSSCTMHAATASMWLPPYSPSAVMPSSPNSPHFLNNSMLNFSNRSCSCA
mmetsp:Transcript_44420/g.74804  ORF Transcript_44420/g.74804 Transcript_44420/m.74804 type:complete len:240 (+) Transcript_44420:1193-1912(+)